VVERHYETVRHAAAYWRQKGWLEKYGPDFLAWAMKFTLLKVKSLPAARRRERSREMLEDIIGGFGLGRYKRSLSFKGRLMWLYFRISERF